VGDIMAAPNIPGGHGAARRRDARCFRGPTEEETTMARSAVRRHIAACLILSALMAVAMALAAGPASAKTTWLCKPGLASNPCVPGLETTRFSPGGEQLGVDRIRRARRPKVDCFYVYPTVSDEKKPQADFNITPELRSIALYQTAYFSRDCRVFAPVYRQITIQGLLQPATVTAAMRESAYQDVRSAWRDYLRRYNKGRGVVFVGHSQGSFVLRRLIAQEVDAKRSARSHLVSAVLLGGNVLVRQGKDRGGDFKHIRACRSSRQLGCVIAYSTFNAPVPAESRFGRASASATRPGGLPTGPDTEVLCTNPAALGGGSGSVDPVYPKEPFAPGTTIGSLTTQIGFPTPNVSTPWISAPGAYDARCSSEGGADVLQVTSVDGAPVLKALPDATWGLHLTDVNIALGNLVDVVRTQANAYAKRHGDR
jgi:Protein of unknown function (DUF3089)